jgi:hypothetical protein
MGLLLKYVKIFIVAPILPKLTKIRGVCLYNKVRLINRGLISYLSPARIATDHIGTLDFKTSES